MPTYIISTSRGDIEVDSNREPTPEEANRIAKEHFGEGGASATNTAIGLGIEVGGAILGGMAGAAAAPFTGGASIPVGAMAGGAIGNVIKQKMAVARGEQEEVKAGEVAGSAVGSLLPASRATYYAARATGIALPALIKAGQGAATSLAATTIEKAIDEQDLPTLKEAAVAAGMGGLVGGVLGGLEKRYQMKGALITNNVLARTLQGATGLGAAAYAYNDARESGDSDPLPRAVLYGLGAASLTAIPSMLAKMDKGKAALAVAGPEAVAGRDAAEIVLRSKNMLEGMTDEAKGLGSLLNQTIAKVRPTLPAAAQTQLDADVLGVLDGRVPSSLLSTYSKDFEPIVKRFSDLRNKYSDDIIALFPEAKSVVSGTIDANRGSYLRRSYKAFQKDALPEVDYDEPAKRAAYKAELVNRFTASGMTPDEANGAAERTMSRILGDSQYLYDGDWLPGKGESAASALMSKNSKLGIALREWLGEVKDDPGQLVANTLSAQAKLVVSGERDKSIREFLLKSGIGKTGGAAGLAGDYKPLIASESSEFHSALGDLQVPQVWSDAFNELMSPNLLGSGDPARWYMTATTLSKASKTVGNTLEAIAPQALGNMMLAASSFKLNPFTLASSVRDTWKAFGWSGQGNVPMAARVAFNTEISEAKKLGVMRGGADVQELRTFFNASLAKDKKPADILESFSKVYGFPDSAVRYMMFKENLKEQVYIHHGAMPPGGLDELKRRAAQVTNDQFPTYDKIPRRLRQASAAMMANAFGAFEFEVVRNSVNQVKYAKDLLAEGRRTGNVNMMKAGAKRLLGMAGVGGATIGIAATANRAFGTSKQDEKDMRFITPSYAADKANIYRIGNDGKFSYAPINYIFPHANTLTAAFIAPATGQNPLPYAKSIFLGNDLGPLGTATIESVTNTYYGTNVPITEPRDNAELAKRWAMRGFMPQVIAGTAARVDKALRGETNRLGLSPTLTDSALRIGGVRQDTLDVIGAFTTRLRDIADPVVGEQTGYRQILRREEASGRSALNEPALYAERNARYIDGQKTLREAYLAAMRLSKDGERGFGQKEILEAFKEAGVPNKLIAGAVFGYQVPMARGIDESNSDFVERAMQDPKMKKDIPAAIDARAGGDPLKRKALYDAYRGKMRSEARGAGLEEKLLGGLDVGSGERAAHIANILKASGSPEAAQAVKLNLINKGIITRDVYFQLSQMGL